MVSGIRRPKRVFNIFGAVAPQADNARRVLQNTLLKTLIVLRTRPQAYINAIDGVLIL